MNLQRLEESSVTQIVETDHHQVEVKDHQLTTMQGMSDKSRNNGVSVQSRTLQIFLIRGSDSYKAYLHSIYYRNADRLMTG